MKDLRLENATKKLKFKISHRMFVRDRFIFRYGIILSDYFLDFLRSFSSGLKSKGLKADVFIGEIFVTGTAAYNVDNVASL